MTSYNNKKLSASMGIGSSSILTVFVLICIVTFAVLSILSARANYNLTKINLNYFTEYTNAENIAEKTLTDIDNILISSFNSTHNEDEYLKNSLNSLKNMDNISFEEENIIFYSVKINETQNLNVKIKIIYPVDKETNNYQILGWYYENIENWESNDKINVLTQNNKLS